MSNVILLTRISSSDFANETKRIIDNIDKLRKDTDNYYNYLFTAACEYVDSAKPSHDDLNSLITISSIVGRVTVSRDVINLVACHKASSKTGSFLKALPKKAKLDKIRELNQHDDYNTLRDQITAIIEKSEAVKAEKVKKDWDKAEALAKFAKGYLSLLSHEDVSEADITAALLVATETKRVDDRKKAEVITKTPVAQAAPRVVAF